MMDSLPPRTAGQTLLRLFCPQQVRTNQDTGLIRLIACICMFIDHAGKMLFPQYPMYRMQNGEYTRSTSDFYGALEKAGFTKKRTNAGRMIIGLRLKDGLDFLE